MLLSDCTGDEIWSIEHCRRVRVPDTWVADCVDAYESGFDDDSQTIYYRDRVVNQFEGVRDVDIACLIAKQLGLNIARLVESSFSRRDLVNKIRETVEEEL
jgi:hypothetical protein